VYIIYFIDLIYILCVCVCVCVCKFFEEIVFVTNITIVNYCIEMPSNLQRSIVFFLTFHKLSRGLITRRRRHLRIVEVSGTRKTITRRM